MGRLCVVRMEWNVAGAVSAHNILGIQVHKYQD